MSFVSFSFLLFLTIAVVLFYILPVKVRKYWLLLASYYFYANTDWKLVFVLLAITACTYIGGIFIRKSRKKAVFWLFFFLNIGVLIVFKYTPFIVNTINSLNNRVHLFGKLDVPELFVPLGLSFIIFQSTTYLGDVYKNKIGKVSIWDHALFVAFFPTILSGPIQKSRDLITQFKFDRAFNQDTFRYGMLLVMYGFFEKLLVADNLALIVDTVYNNYENYGSLYYLFAAICYSFQIYADFSSYSDIARGVAKMLGIEITKNFTNPYLSRNLVDFWKNWHVSLNNWLVEYVYIPLGGSRKGSLRKYVNTLIVFLISGLWHGASWHFVIWGGLNGLLQIIGQLTKKCREHIKQVLGINEESLVLCWGQRGIVFALITFTWIFFRAPSMSVALHFISNIISLPITELFDTNVWTIFGSMDKLVGLLIAMWIFIKIQILRKEEGRIYRLYMGESAIVRVIGMAVVMAILIVCICTTMAQPDASFIYFQF